MEDIISFTIHDKVLTSEIINIHDNILNSVHYTATAINKLTIKTCHLVQGYEVVVSCCIHTNNISFPVKEFENRMHAR